MADNSNFVNPTADSPQIQALPTEKQSRDNL